MSEDIFLEAIEPSLKAAGIRGVTNTQLEIFVLLWWAIQAITMGLYLATFGTATLHSASWGEIHIVQMTGAAWLHSLPAVILVTVIEAADWLATLSILSVGILGMVRRAERQTLLLVLLALVDVTITNVPCSDPYQNGLWVIEQTPSTLRVEYAAFFRRETITVAELGGLDTVCVATRAGFPWRRTTTAEFHYQDGRSGRLVVGGFLAGVYRSSFGGLQRELRVALKLLADRAGAVYLDRPPAGCQPPSSADLKERTLHALRRVWGSISPAIKDPFHAAKGPFNVALAWWIGLLFVITRTRWAKKTPKARGRLGRFFVMGEGLLGGLLWAVVLAILPARLLALGLHHLLGDVHIPALVGTPNVDVTAVQLALLITMVEVLSVFRATLSPAPTYHEYPVGLPVLYYFNLVVGWLLGWAVIAFSKGESTSLSASLRFFRPPALWHNWIQDTATFAFLLILAVDLCAALTEFHAETLRARGSR
ncbi:MAG: hypothetical protein LAO06_07960 [Acidobacteriia bacterium]|nr:hypothetical protein [Terriglobia bacterium]